MEITPVINQDFLTFQEDMTLSEMIGKLKQYEKRSGLVFRNKKYLGLVEKKRLLRVRMDASEAKVGHFIHHTPLIGEHADIMETAALMFQSDVDHLPVERNKEIIGVVTALEVAKLGAELPEAGKLKVADVKLIKPSKVTKDAPLATAIEVMFKERVDQVPIYDQGKLSGIISYRDLLRKYLNWSPKRDVSAKFNKAASTRSAEGDMPNLANLPVSNFSTNDNLAVIQQNDSLKNALQQMVKSNVSDLLVMKGDQFQGMLTVKNVLRIIGGLKIPKRFALNFVGLNQLKLETFQKYALQKIASNEALKLQRMIHNENFAVNIHVKAYEKQGNQQKYSVHMRIESPGHIFNAAQEDWELNTALHKTFDNLKNEIKKRFRGDSSMDRKVYG